MASSQLAGRGHEDNARRQERKRAGTSPRSQPSSYIRLSGCLGYDFATTPATVAAPAPAPPPLSAIASVPSDRRRLFCSGD